MTILRVDHVQLAMPEGGEAQARAFYGGLLELPERPKPMPLAGRGGVWFERGPLKIHLGVEPDFRPANKAHPGLLVDDLESLTTRLEAAGHPLVQAEPLEGQPRAFVFDPFGNRLELIQAGS